MELIDALYDLCSKAKHPVIAIDGAAGAGKTTLASHIESSLSRRISVQTIHMDDLYNGWQNPFDENFSNNLKSIIQAHRDSAPLSYRRFDWQKNSYTEPLSLPHTELLILEGVGSSLLEIDPFLTVRIWLDIDEKIGFQRVIARDGQHLSSEMERWLEMQKQHFSSQDPRNRADFILTT